MRSLIWLLIVFGIGSLCWLGFVLLFTTLLIGDTTPWPKVLQGDDLADLVETCQAWVIMAACPLLVMQLAWIALGVYLLRNAANFPRNRRLLPEPWMASPPKEPGNERIQGQQ
jgi:hypothetical protein